MKQFVDKNWFNLISLGIMLVTLGVIYGKLETRVTFNEGILKEMSTDVKSILSRVSVLEARK